MSGDTSCEIAIRIDEKLSQQSDTWEKRSIFKVHGKQRSDGKEAYKDAYDPQVVSIGPYHHGKNELKKMEMYKLRCLQELLKSRGQSSAKKFIMAMAAIKDRARSYYAEEISPDEGFVEMLCLDGCFVIGFLRKLRRPELFKENDPISQMPWLKAAIKRDLILFENQLPFFVLRELFEMIKLSDEENLIDLAIGGLCSILPGAYPDQTSYSNLAIYGVSFPLAGSHPPVSADEVVHLLDLMHTHLTASFSKTLPPINDMTLLFSIIPQLKDPKPEDTTILQKSAIELLHSGTNFRRAKKPKSLFDITYENGVIKIPPLFVDDHTETIFRNLIAYEQYMSKPSETRRCVTDYISFMDLLIDYPSDVEKLRKRDIIMHGIGSDQAVSAMFNKLSSDVSIDINFCYTEILLRVRKYSSNPCHRWTAILRRNHLNTPWAIISVLAACVLLLLTMVQTIFSILQYTQ